MESPSLPFDGGQSSLGSPVETDVIHRGSRRKREFTPDDQKDALYWEKRRKNNEAAKRSREKRRINDYVLETRLMALKEENARLKAELMALKVHFGLAHPAAYTAFQLSQMKEHVHSSAQSKTIQPSLPRDYYWRSPDPSFMPYHQPSHCVLVPALQSTRGYTYLNQHSSTSSSLLAPLIFPKDLQPAPFLHPGPALVRPNPRKVPLDENQGVPGGPRNASPVLFCSNPQQETDIIYLHKKAA